MTTCHECPNTKIWSRGLCNTHYRQAQRAGLLQDYPTQEFMDNPEHYIRWAYAYFPELIEEIAIEFSRK